MKHILLLIITLLTLCATTAAAQDRDLSSCQKWGYAPSDFATLTTISYLTSPGSYGEGIKMPRNAQWKDCTIEGVSVPVVMTGMKDLRCIVASDSRFTNILTEVSVPDGTLHEGYCDIAFPQPVGIPQKDIYVGYTYRTTENGASLAVYDDIASGGLYLCMSGSWMDYSAYKMGVSGLQVLIGSPSEDDYCLQCSGVEWANVLCGATTVSTTLRSSCKQPVTTFDYTITTPDGLQQGTISLPTAIDEGMERIAIVELPITAPATAQHFDATISITAVNGSPNSTAAAPYTAHLNAVSRQVVRRSVVEEFTGTDCGFCPRGWLGMETLKEENPDRFIGIAIHQYNQSDPMYVAGYAKLPFIGAPSCFIDRATKDICPYNGSGHYPTIRGDFAYYNALLPDVDVTLSAALSPDGTSVEAEADIEFLGEAEGYSVAYVLTADGLEGSTSAWTQENYFYTMDPSAIVNEAFPELAQFCAGGALGEKRVHLVYGDVFLDSSWDVQGTSLTDALPAATPGSHFSSAYTLKLPTKKVLAQALDLDRLYAVAIVFDASGRVANAARTLVGQPTAIVSPTNGAPTHSDVYTLDGRRTQAAGTKGITIVEGRKVVNF